MSIVISDDPRLLNEPYVYDYLHERMYWAKSLTYEVFKRSVRHSAVVFGVCDGKAATGDRGAGEAIGCKFSENRKRMARRAKRVFFITVWA